MRRTTSLCCLLTLALGFLFLSSTQASAWTKKVTVCQSGKCDYYDIAYAAANAGPNVQIDVLDNGPGGYGYPGNIYLQYNQTVIGTKGTTVVDCSLNPVEVLGTVPSTTGSYTVGFFLNNGDTVMNLSVNNCGVGVLGYGTKNDDVKCIIFNWDYVGVALNYWATKDTVQQSNFNDNFISIWLCDTTYITIQKDVICGGGVILTSATLTTADTTFNFEDGYSLGILVKSSSNVLIDQVTVKGVDAGIVLVCSNCVTVQNSKANYNAVGIALIGSYNNLICGNNFDKNFIFGGFVDCNSYNNTIKNNHAEWNGVLDWVDLSTGTGTLYTANYYKNNKFGYTYPAGLP